MAESFKRSDVAFFHQPSYQEAVLRLASANPLVLYCGAGVTIDRTGMGWGRLIGSVFSPDSSDHRSHPDQAEIDLMQGREDPLRLASILTQYGLDKAENEQDLKEHLTPLLQNRLYKSTGWQAGLLTKNVCAAAAAAAFLGTEVHIITTNYDTYLESSFQKVVGRMRQIIESGRIPDEQREEALPKMPSLSVFVTELSTDEEMEIHLPDSSVDQEASVEGPRVSLHYLHGRVPKSGDADGHLVISEHDYAMSRGKTVNTLRRLFSPGSGVIILGASLTDPPLIDALALTKPSPSRPGGQVAPSRFVVMPRTSLGYLDLPRRQNDRIVAHLGRRCELLGSKLVAPDFRVQVGQLLEELRLCLSYDDPSRFFEDGLNARYGLRLVEWWRKWSARPIASDSHLAHGELYSAFQKLLEFIEEARSSSFGPTPSRERFRLELWVRADPAENRCLTLWAYSSGILLDDKIRRRAELQIEAPNASVRAFTEGRPQHYNGSDILPYTAAPSQIRWNSYFAVPIFVAIGGGEVAVGTLTLASTVPISDSALPLPKIKQMEALRNQMIEMGRMLLAMNDSEPAAVL